MIGNSVYTAGCATPADRTAVYEAITDILRHGIYFLFDIADIYITARGVRFASASSAKYYQDRDVLAKEAEFMWETLANIFDHMDDDPLKDRLVGSRLLGSCGFIIPRLPSPGRPIATTPEEAIIRWIWSITLSDECYYFNDLAFKKLHALYGSSERSVTRREKRIKGDNRALLPPDDFSCDLGVAVARTGSMDKPLVANRASVARQHPYARPRSTRLLLPKESEVVASI